MTAHFARNYLPENGVLLDLGCSTGNVSDSCRETITTRNASVVNVDNSEEMADLFKGVGEVTIANIENFEIPEFDVCVMFLSMMFVPVNSRSSLIMELMKKTRKGGLVLIVDKMESFSGYSGQVINRLSLVNKLDAGAKPDDVLAKELSLSGVQRPISPELLNSFTKWFQIGEFCGYLYEG
nr:class I SAM-dependent methyltransferase [Vibrio crassostreae]